MDGAKIAILMATYNGARYLRAQLDSLLNQQEQDWQLIVSDDGSTDETPQILAEYQARLPQKITLLSHAPTGSSRANFMLLTRQAGAFDYVMYCDQDDVWLPQKVGMTLRKMREIEGDQRQVPCLVHSDLSVVDEELKLQQESFFYSSMLRPDRDPLHYLVIQNIVTGCTMMINHALWQLAVLPCDESAMRMHDMWFALIASSLGRIGFVNRPTMLYRQHSGNVVGAKNVRSLRYIAAAFSRLRQNRESIRQCQRQAGALADTLGDRLRAEQRALLTAYADCAGQSKFARWRVIFKYRIWLLGWRRKIAELLLI